jgi:2-octaprenylphenol hydroxylase
MYVWDDNSSGVLSFKAQELGLAHLGHIIEERVLKQALLSVIATMDNVSLHVQCTLKSVVVNDDMAFLETSLGDISSKLVIGADGANSWLRKHLSFDCQASPYPHHALVCHVQTEKAHQKTAYQIFLEEGPLAFLPLKNDKQCSIVWSMPKDKAIARMQLSNDEFCQQLEEASQLKLGAISNLSKRVSFPLIERQVNPFIKLRVALVGDALHTIHPLAGLGMNLGLADVDALQKVVQENRRNFDDFLTLRKYERRRKGHVKLITTLMSILSMAFSNAGIPPFLRSIGMNSISQSAFLKSQVIKLASGI